MALIPMIAALAILLALVAGVIVLQVYLSKRDSRIYGLILPALSLIFSLVAVMGLVAFTVVKTSASYEVIGDNGEVIEMYEEEPVETESGGITILGAVTAFIVCNIPTIILLAIYGGCREKLRRADQLDKMAIQDLG